MLNTPCLQYIHKNKNVKVTSTERDYNNVSYFEQKYSSYAVECKNYFSSPPHLLECKRNKQHNSMNIIVVWFTSHCSNILVHLCIVYSSRISQIILHKLFNMNSNVKCPSIIFNIMSYVKYSIHLVLCQTSVHFNFDQFNIMSYANISTNKHLKQF